MSEIYRRYNQNQPPYSALPQNQHRITPQHQHPSTASSGKSGGNPNPISHPTSAAKHNTVHSKTDLSSDALQKTPHRKETDVPPKQECKSTTPMPNHQRNTPKSIPQNASKSQRKGFSPQALYNLIPKSLYNPETKKILGLLDAEDLLIIALIFLFMEDTEEDNPLMLLALFYILLSDSFDIGDFLF